MAAGKGRKRQAPGGANARGPKRQPSNTRNIPQKPIGSKANKRQSSGSKGRDRAKKSQGGERQEYQLNGVVRIRDQFATADTAQELENPDLQELLTQRLTGLETPVLDFRDTDVTVLDIDNHDSQFPAETIEQIPGQTPGWDLAHRTHRDGLHLFFTGENHETRALVAILHVPGALSVELKRQARHPLATHPLAPESRAGPVLCGPGGFVPLPKFGFDERARDRWLAEHDMEVGGRYAHEKCPICPNPTSGTPPVLVNAFGLKCFYCEGKGRKLEGHLNPGWVPFSAFCGVGNELADCAKHLVHWSQALHQLRHYHPNIPEALLRKLYRLALCQTHSAEDPRVVGVFNDDLCCVQGAGGIWLNATTFELIEKLDNDFLDSLPACQWVETKPKKKRKGGHTKDSEGEGGEDKAQDDERPDVKVKRSKRFRARHQLLDGYKPLSPVPPPDVGQESPEGVVPVLLPTRADIRLLREPLPEQECEDELQRAFPGLHYQLVKGTIVAVFCVQKYGGQPPFIWAKGPTGSGKNTSFSLGGAFLGEPPLDLTISGEEEKFWRAIGSGLVRGQRIFALDELGKDKLDRANLARLLRIKSQITWRRLYKGPSVLSRCRACFVIPCASVPDHLLSVGEFVRRTVLYPLLHEVPNWRDTSGGDVFEWCSASHRNRQIANSVLTHAFQAAADNAFVWGRAAPMLGFVSLRDAELDSTRRQAMAALYEACRNTPPEAFYPSEDPTFGANWIRTDAIIEAITACVSLDPDHKATSRLKIIKSELEAQDWNAVLGISEPDIECKLSIHGTKAGIRFQSANMLKGREKRNSDLPPATGVSASGPAVRTTSPDADGNDRSDDSDGTDLEGVFLQ